MEPVKILMIEDNPGDARLIQDMLAEAKNVEFALDWKQTLTGGLDSLGRNTYDAVLLDLGLPDSPQRSASFTRVQTAAPTLPIIVLTGLDDETFAVTTVRRGAQDYLVKGKIDAETLVRTAFVVVAVIFLAHFYLRTLHPNFPESLASMLDGKVSESYARDHYSKWNSRASDSASRAD